MRSLLLGAFLCCLCSLNHAPVHAEEGVPAPAVSQEILQLQQLVQSLQDAVQDLNQTVKNQNEVIREQVVRINALEKEPAQTAPAGADQTQKSPLPLGGISQKWNPEIGVVGTVQGHLTENSEDGEGRDTIALKELELSFAQYVDPYSRLDAIIAFNDNLEEQNVDVEEAYYSHWGLPFGFTGRVGKFRAKVGKQNLLHLHQLETVDYPLVIQDFFGEEGLSSSGIRLQNNIPNPWDIPLTLTGEMFRGNNGDSFSGISRRPIFNTHLGSFFELNDSSNVELGSSFTVGDENINSLDGGDDRYGVHVFGVDFTWNWNMAENKKLKWQNELFYQDRTNLVVPNHDPWGFYSLLDYRFSPRWSAGIRFDYLEPRTVIDEHGRTTAVSPYITFWQSEFASFRLQYQHLDAASADAKSDDALFFQINFLIGAHSHPVS